MKKITKNEDKKMVVNEETIKSNSNTTKKISCFAIASLIALNSAIVLKEYHKEDEAKLIEYACLKIPSVTRIYNEEEKQIAFFPEEATISPFSITAKGPRGMILYGNDHIYEGEEDLFFLASQKYDYVKVGNDIYTQSGNEKFAKVKITTQYDATKVEHVDENGNVVTYYVAPKGGTVVGDKVILNKTKYIKIEDDKEIIANSSEIINIEEIIQAKPYSELLNTKVSYTVNSEEEKMTLKLKK